LSKNSIFISLFSFFQASNGSLPPHQQTATATTVGVGAYSMPRVKRNVAKVDERDLLLYGGIMNTATMQQARILTVEELKTWRRPLPKGWNEAAGMLKGDKRILDPVAYQKTIRKEWEDRFQKQLRLAGVTTPHDD